MCWTVTVFQCMPSLARLVTPWMSVVTGLRGRALNSSSVERTGLSTFAVRVFGYEVVRSTLGPELSSSFTNSTSVDLPLHAEGGCACAGSFDPGLQLCRLEGHAAAAVLAICHRRSSHWGCLGDRDA